MHKEIGVKLGIPRSTISRWFKQLGIPSQSCTRFTNKNLKHPPRKPKPPKKPHFRLPVNENFFKNWSPEMAYVREILDSNHKIGVQDYENRKGKVRYCLQIGGKRIFQDLLNLGLIPNKSKRIKLPQIPEVYFEHFIRGYFDGDGCVDFGFYQKKDRKNPSFSLITRFSSGNRKFLENLLKCLQIYAGIKGGCIYQKQEGGYDLSFSARDSFKLYEFMYKDAKEFLERKYKEFQEAIKYHGGVV